LAERWGQQKRDGKPKDKPTGEVKELFATWRHNFMPLKFTG
jgi:hypothetical protein